MAGEWLVIFSLCMCISVPFPSQVTDPLGHFGAIGTENHMEMLTLPSSHSSLAALHEKHGI